MIMVDSLQPTLISGVWKWPQGCHMFCDSLDEEGLRELHTFALRLGLKRSWFQHKPGKLPHYDLTGSKRREAVKRGAFEVDRHTVVEWVHYWRLRSQFRPNRAGDRYLCPGCGITNTSRHCIQEGCEVAMQMNQYSVRRTA